MKILLVKTSSFGDVIHTFPVVSYLKQKFPSSQIDWVVEEPIRELLESHPSVHRVLPVETKQWRRGKKLNTYQQFRKRLQQETYDIVFDLQGNLKSGLITWLAKAKEKAGFAYSDVSEWPNVLFTNKRYSLPSGQNIREDYLSIVRQHFGDEEPYNDAGVHLTVSNEQACAIKTLLQHPDFKNEKKVLVCPGSAWKNKQLPYENLIQVLKGLQPCSFLLLWGSVKEKELAQKLHVEFPSSMILERLSLPMLQNLMRDVDLVLSMDSLPLHLAGTTATPTLSFFGPSNAEKYRPKGSQHRSFQGECPYGKIFEKRCPILRSCATGACIRSLPGNKNI